MRPIVDQEVRKVIGWREIENGFTLYECECGNAKVVPFRCKSRLCNCCGYQYQIYRAQKIKSKLINCNHRHIVFTIAEELRIFFRIDRGLLNILFQSAAQTISDWLYAQNKAQKLTCGMVSTLHTFGRDLKWNPHIHMLVSMCAAGNGVPYKLFNHLPFAMLRKRFMTTLLFNLKNALQKTKYASRFNGLVNKIYKEKENGFYVYAYAKLTGATEVIEYMVRYIGRPAIAQKRILRYENGLVTFCYNRHEDEKYVEETIPVYEFIQRVAIHVPEKYFNMVRYYGLYAKPHNLALMKRQPPHRIARQLNLWFIRIWQAFHYNPLKCACGKLMKFSGFFFQDTS